MKQSLAFLISICLCVGCFAKNIRYKFNNQDDAKQTILDSEDLKTYNNRTTRAPDEF